MLSLPRSHALDQHLHLGGVNHLHSGIRRGTSRLCGTTTPRPLVQCRTVTSEHLVSDLGGVAAPMNPTTTSSHPGSKPMLSMRPITTHFNVMVLGTHHVGRIPFIKMAELPEASADKTAPRSLPPQAELNLQDQVWGSASPHAAFAEDPSAWATTMKPVMLPEACREIVYTVQDTPGQGSVLDPFIHVACLLGYVLKQQAKDYTQLAGSRGLHKSLACGCLEHSPTACIYTLPPEGPNKVDLMSMSVLNQHVAVLPVITGPSSADGESCRQLVSKMLQNTAAYVKGLEPLELIKFAELCSPAPDMDVTLPLLLHNLPPEKVAQALVRLLSSDQVYILLDAAWDKYNTCCKEYEAAGQNIDTLLATNMNKLFTSVAQSTSNYRTTSYGSGYGRRR